MKMLAMAFVGALFSWVHPAQAEPKGSSGPCKLRIGKARPTGCAPYRSRMQQRERKPPSKTALRPAAPEAPWIDDLRAPQRRANQKQSQRLLIQELTRLERLLRVTRPSSPDRARMIRRLAEGYAELELLAGHERRLAEARAEHAEKQNRRRRALDPKR